MTKKIFFLRLFQKFTYSGGENITHHEIDDFITMKIFRFEPISFNCFQFELYGCPEGKKINDS